MLAIERFHRKNSRQNSCWPENGGCGDVRRSDGKERPRGSLERLSQVLTINLETSSGQFYIFSPRPFWKKSKKFSFVIASTNTCGLEVAFGVFVKIKVDKWTGEGKPNRIDAFVADLFMTFRIYRGWAWICICKGFCSAELRRFRKCGISLYLCSGWERIDRRESVSWLLWSQSD